MDDVTNTPLAQGRISYLMTTVRDFSATIAFYRKLGFEDVYVEEGECAFLRLPGDPGPQLSFYPGRAAGSTDPNWMLIVDVPDIDAVTAMLTDMGISVGAVEDVPYGRAATFTDPDGNLIEIHQRNRA